MTTSPSQPMAQLVAKSWCPDLAVATVPLTQSRPILRAYFLRVVIFIGYVTQHVLYIYNVFTYVISAHKILYVTLSLAKNPCNFIRIAYFKCWKHQGGCVFCPPPPPRRRDSTGWNRTERKRLLCSQKIFTMLPLWCANHGEKKTCPKSDEFQGHWFLSAPTSGSIPAAKRDLPWWFLFE